MALPTYSSGTVTVLDGSTALNFVGAILSRTNARAGDTIFVNNRFPGIDLFDVGDDYESATIPVPWEGGDQVNVPYTIIQNFPARVAGVEAAKDVSILVAALNKEGFYWFVGPNEAVPDPSRGDEGQYARKPTTGEEWLKQDGLWLFQGIFGTLSATDQPWSSSTTYANKIIVPYAGRLWRSLQANNIGHEPSTSPAWWSLFLSGGDAYDIANFDTDRPASGENILEFIFTKTVTFYAGMTDSRARAKTGATGNAVFHFQKNGVDFATLTFAASGQGGAQVGVFSCPADTIFTPGDRLSIIAPATRDPTLSAIAWTIAGYRV